MKRWNFMSSTGKGCELLETIERKKKRKDAQSQNRVKPGWKSAGSIPSMALYYSVIRASQELLGEITGESVYGWVTNLTAVCANLSQITKNQTMPYRVNVLMNFLYKSRLLRLLIKSNLKMVPDIYYTWRSAFQFSYFPPTLLFNFHQSNKTSTAQNSRKIWKQKDMQPWSHFSSLPSPPR